MKSIQTKRADLEKVVGRPRTDDIPKILLRSAILDKLLKETLTHRILPDVNIVQLAGVGSDSRPGVRHGADLTLFRQLI